MFTMNRQIKIIIQDNLRSGQISGTKLVYGLCTRKYLEKLLQEENTVNLRLLRILLQRLGKSTNKLELVLPKEEIDTETAQLHFRESIEAGEDERAARQLEEYRRLAEGGERLDCYYYLRNRASYEFYALKERDTALETLEEAIETTLPGWREKKMDRVIISSTEMEGILFYLYLRYRRDGEDLTGLKEAKKYKDRIRRTVTDEEEAAAIMPKACFLMASLYVGVGAYEEAVAEGEEGLNYLRECGMLHLMLPLLEIIVRYGEGKKLREPYENYVKYREILAELEGTYGSGQRATDYFFGGCQKMICHYDAEMIAGQRRKRGYTQEQMAEKAEIAPEMVSRYEHGKQSPNKTTFPRVMDALGLEYRKQNTLLVCEDFGVLEKAQEIIQLICDEENDKAEEELRRLDQMLDHSYRKNINTLRNLQCAVEAGREGADYGKILQCGRELLEETYSLEDEKLKRPPFQDEARLITQIAVCYSRMNQQKEASRIYEKVMEAIRNSYVDTRLRLRMYCLFLSNYAHTTRKREDIEVGIRYCLKCRTLSSMEMQVSNLAVTYYQENKEKSRELMEMSFHLAKLLGKRKNQERILNHIRKYYD